MFAFMPGWSIIFFNFVVCCCACTVYICISSFKFSKIQFVEEKVTFFFSHSFINKCIILIMTAK